MKVKEFVSLGYNTIYKVVDGGKCNGSARRTLCVEERNRVVSKYGEWTVVGFEPYSVATITLYVKQDNAE